MRPPRATIQQPEREVEGNSTAEERMQVRRWSTDVVERDKQRAHRRVETSQSLSRPPGLRFEVGKHLSDSPRVLRIVSGDM